MKCLRKLADAGLAILCTIHQPSGSLFEQFDRLLLLQKGGRCVYFGDIGVHSKDVIGYLESNGATKCPARANPAECMKPPLVMNSKMLTSETSPIDRD